MTILYFNSSINETHRSSNYNVNVENNKKVSENAFINKLIKLHYNIIKDINDKLIKLKILILIQKNKKIQ